MIVKFIASMPRLFEMGSHLCKDLLAESVYLQESEYQVFGFIWGVLACSPMPGKRRIKGTEMKTS